MIVELAAKSIKRIEKLIKKSKKLFDNGERDYKKYTMFLLKQKSYGIDISTMNSEEALIFLKLYKKDIKNKIGVSELEYDHEISGETIGEPTSCYYAYCLDSLQVDYLWYEIIETYTDKMIRDMMIVIQKERIAKNDTEENRDMLAFLSKSKLFQKATK